MRYDPQTQTVTIRPLAAEGNGPVELEALEFIARVCHERRQRFVCGAVLMMRVGPSDSACRSRVQIT
jgi:hypothetical protein